MPEFRSDPDHEAVLGSSARHLVVTAPPGTGKTFLSVRLAAMLAPTLPPEGKVLLLTFSNQARTQLEREVVRQLSAKLRRQIEVTNYHRFFWQGVLAYRRVLKLPMELDIGSTQRRQQALQRAGDGILNQALRSKGVLESLAEHSFTEFQDQRTPDERALARLLTIVEEEQQAGRLVFDDLGALFWSLLEQHPVVDQAYRARYPMVIADEHQDASALQDAVVRRLGHDRMVIFADSMQLIHEFRGASLERLERHLAECEEQHTLGTAHRWHGREELARWLLAVRDRLQGHAAPCSSPPQLRIERSPANRGFNGMKPQIRNAVRRAFQEDAMTVAVLARANDQVADLRSYLSRQGQHPRQVGTEDFEDARRDIERLPILGDSQAVALHAVERLQTLVPTIRTALLAQVRNRLLPQRINFARAGPDATRILRALEPIYIKGPASYFESLTGGLDAAAETGHHLPRSEAVRALRTTAAILACDPAVDLDLALEHYSAAVLAGAQAAPRLGRGLFVMTAHQAKGKEFDAIIVADAMERFWPDNEDSRRLFYVVLTRASHSWTVVAPDQGATALLGFLT